MARVLVACEYSARVRDAFRARGHDAWSCDLLPTDGDPTWHLQRDVRLALAWGRWDCLIAFPPCTHLSSVGARYWPAKIADGRQGAALDFVRVLMDAPIRHIAVENPSGKINTAIRKADQIIQPWQFGDPWTKRTCLWLKGLPILLPDNIVEPKGYWVGGGSIKDGRSISNEGAYQATKARHGSARYADTAHDRNRSFPGIARAMADQWGSYLDSLSMPLAA